MRQLNMRQRGFTLIELMVTISIAALLTVAGLPSYADYAANSRLREGANVVASTSLMARSEAIKRNGTVRVSVVDQRVQVASVDGTTVTVLRSAELPANVQTSAFTADFDSAGRLAPFGTELTVSMSSTTMACSNDIRCPAIHLEAGGAVTVCKTGVCE